MPFVQTYPNSCFKTDALNIKAKYLWNFCWRNNLKLGIVYDLQLTKSIYHFASRKEAVMAVGGWCDLQNISTYNSP